MAKKKKVVEGDEEADEGTKKKKKKPIVPIVVVLLGLFGAKTFLLKDPAPTPDQLKAAEKAKALTLYNKCAEANGLPAAPDVPTDAPTTTTRGTTTTKGQAASRHPLRLELVSTHGGTVEIAAAATAPAVEGMGPVLSLDSVTVNLADNHYLKLGLALQLDVGGDATTGKDLGLGAKALDMALTELAKHTMKELIAPAERESIKQSLGFQTCQSYKGAVVSVYFTEFVMQ